MMKRKIIAIDPDVDLSGVGVVQIIDKERVFLTCKKSFADLLDFVHGEYIVASEGKYRLEVIVEAGWLCKKSNYHKLNQGLPIAKRQKIAENIAKKVGSNHQVGKLLVSMLKRDGIEADIVHPLKKTWKGPDGKITQGEMESLLKSSGFTEKLCRCNQDERDALLLALVYSGIPLRMPYDNN